MSENAWRGKSGEFETEAPRIIATLPMAARVYRRRGDYINYREKQSSKGAELDPKIGRIALGRPLIIKVSPI